MFKIDLIVKYHRALKSIILYDPNKRLPISQWSSYDNDSLLLYLIAGTKNGVLFILLL